MAVDSVDDYYYGWGEKMAEKVKKEYLEKEMCNSEFKKLGKKVKSMHYMIP